MTKYVLYRLVAAVPVVFGVTLLVFLMVRIVPGDPVDIMLANQRGVKPETKEAMRRQLGLDKPIPEQYVRFLFNSLQGDFGESYKTRKPVFEEIRVRMPNT